MSVGNQTQAVQFDKSQLTLVLGQNLDLGGDDVGARNGTGKTTIVNALSYAMYGEALTKIRKDNLINKTNNKNMLVTVEFENFDNNDDDGECFAVQVMPSGDCATISVQVEPAAEWEISGDGEGTGYDVYGCSTPDSFTEVFEYSGDGHPNGIENLPPICEFTISPQECFE